MAEYNNKIAHLKINSYGSPEIYFSSDNGQTFTGGTFLPVKSHTTYELNNPPQTTLNAFSHMNWDTEIILPTYGHGVWATHTITVPFAGGDSIVATNIYINTQNGHLVVECYNAGNSAATNIQLLIVNIDEYWRKGINY